jgi:hypothetical protein
MYTGIPYVPGRDRDLTWNNIRTEYDISNAGCVQLIDTMKHDARMQVDGNKGWQNKGWCVSWWLRLVAFFAGQGRCT